MDTDPFPYIMNAEKRRHEQEEAVKARYRKALSLAKQAADLLRTTFCAEKVVLFGSVAQEELFHSRADIDLAVWGLPGNLYFIAVGQLQALDPEISIDLILFEEARESLQRTILKHGIKI
jgi:uncharacterized protein